MTRVLLVGNPNCGKTTLFNALTGDNQRIGNWPGVTVEKKTGRFSYCNHQVEVTDLPGVYSLVIQSAGNSPDELITAQAVLEQTDAIINVIDACHLERHLYLTSQLLELGKPVIIALNMMDIAHQRGITIDEKALANQLQCPVIALQAHRSLGLDALKKTVLAQHAKATPLDLNLPLPLRQTMETIKKRLENTEASLDLEQSNGFTEKTAYIAHRLVEGDIHLLAQYPVCVAAPNDADILIADARYHAIHDLVAAVQRKRADASEHLTARIDRIVLHRLWALPIFFAVMYVMFLFAINVGGAFQEFFDIATDTVFVQGGAALLNHLHAPAWVVALGANGVGKGINTTLTFIPVIAAMFFFLSFLELSGYMARAAFAVDKLMRLLGLPGKSFVPMIVGFGCNVPAIMAARTIDCERDRLLTVLMSPFMSCSARLAIYAVFVAAFFPIGGQNIVFSLYLMGILMAVLTGLLLRKTLLGGQYSPLILELPSYHKPSLRRLIKDTLVRLRHFVWRAGKLIIPICMLLGGLNALTLEGNLSLTQASSESVLSLAGQWLTPFFAPLGLQAENWPATVGLLTGMLAKEVVIGSLNTLYAQSSGLASVASSTFDFWTSLQDAFYSIPHNLSHLGHALLNPISASASFSDWAQSTYGVMHERFDGQAGAYAYLLFILLYIPCVSTMAAIRQEASRKLMWFSISWSFIVAYFTAVLFYQTATFAKHPQQSCLWLLTGAFLLFTLMVVVQKKYPQQGETYAAANP